MKVGSPPGWTRAPAEGRRVSLRPPDPGLHVLVWPLLARGSVELASLVSHERPPLSRIEILQTMELATETGWRMQLVTVDVRGPEGTLEMRLAALYEVVHWAGFALAIATEPASYERHRQALVEMFTSATPDLHALEPACVKDLFRMDLP